MRNYLNMNPQLLTAAVQNISDILTLSIKYKPSTEKALVIYDTEHELTNILTLAYQTALPHAHFVDIASVSKQSAIELINTYSKGDLVILIQTGSFRLDDFRIRLHLFNNGLKVIEHLHLYRNTPDQWETYINSLEYDPNWYHKMGRWLEAQIIQANSLEITSPNGNTLTTAKLEAPKLNIGDFTGMTNIGSTYPIGEVFTEAQDFATMYGRIEINAFANENFEIEFHSPFWVEIRAGHIVQWSPDAPASFIVIIQKVQEFEPLLIREIGFGLNRAISNEKPLNDITAFERKLGVHMSLGHKHSVYKKPGISAGKAKFHVDLFLAVASVKLGNDDIFHRGEYTLYK